MSEFSANMSLRQVGRENALRDLARMGPAEREKKLGEIAKSMGRDKITLPELREVHKRMSEQEIDALVRAGV